LCVCVVAGLGGRLPAQVGNQGTWENAFNHEFNTANTNFVTPPAGMIWPSPFNAIHMALVPIGPRRGMVLVWHGNQGVQTDMPWAYVNPNWAGAGNPDKFLNGILPMPFGVRGS
jgi:hypothetical protein